MNDMEKKLSDALMKMARIVQETGNVYMAIAEIASEDGIRASYDETAGKICIRAEGDVEDVDFLGAVSMSKWNTGSMLRFYFSFDGKRRRGSNRYIELTSAGWRAGPTRDWRVREIAKSLNEKEIYDEDVIEELFDRYKTAQET